MGIAKKEELIKTKKQKGESRLARFPGKEKLWAGKTFDGGDENKISKAKSGKSKTEKKKKNEKNGFSLFSNGLANCGLNSEINICDLN